MYNRADAENRLRSIGGDAQTMIDYMHDKKCEDPGHKCFFSTDKQGRLASIIWRDSTSLQDYSHFSDTLVFDSTYKTNLYNKPLVLFMGANNHRASVLFACALIIDETTESYVWLLTAFLSMMNGITPTSVLTDGDEAIHNAVVTVLPQAKHRVCTWHVSRIIGKMIKDKDIFIEFENLLYKPMSVASFERRWVIMVDRIRGGGSWASVISWLDSMYRKRERWAATFFAGKFFAMMTNTQRCEGMNRHLKRGLSRVTRVFDLPYRVAASLYRMRQKVAKADYDSRYLKPEEPKFMVAVHEQLGCRLTGHLYDIAKKQLDRVSKYNVIGNENYPETGCMSWVIKEAFKRNTE